MLTRIVCLLLPLLAACGPIVAYPTTEGYHSVLPAPNTRVLVWATHPAVTDTATSWLQKRGLAMLEPAGLRRMLAEDQVPLTHTREDEGHVIHAGSRLGANVVVFAESEVKPGKKLEQNNGNGHGHGPAGQIYRASVSLRGVRLDTHEVIWSGNARMTHRFHGTVDESLAKLTCQALATAWAFRPAGHHRISSLEMCEIHE